MIFLKYIDEDKIHEVTFDRTNDSVIELKGNIPICEKGFDVYRNADDEIPLGNYPDYNTVYLEGDGFVQYSNDNSVYQEPEPFKMSEESFRSAKMEQLKMDLQNTDYQVIKCAEYQLVGNKQPYDIEALHKERQDIRDEINILGKELN